MSVPSDDNDKSQNESTESNVEKNDAHTVEVSAEVSDLNPLTDESYEPSSGSEVITHNKKKSSRKATWAFKGMEIVFTAVIASLLSVLTTLYVQPEVWTHL